MVSYKVNGLKVEIKNPYAIVLLPEFNVVRYGEKEQMEIEYKKIIEKIENYIEKENQDELVKEINEILKQYNFDINYPTMEQIRDLKNDYWLIPIENNQEEFEKVTNITGYLKNKYLK